MEGVFCIYQKGLHPRKSIHFLDEEDINEVCLAYHAKKESISANGERIELFYNVFKIYNLLEKFENPFDAEEYFRKNKAFVNFDFALNSLKTESEDVTKKYLKKSKTGTVKSRKKENMEANKIFISHSSDDLSIVDSFVDEILKLGMEIPRKRIFCSSMEGHGIQNGK